MNQNELLPECPFYIAEGKRGVRCEGLVKGSSLRLNFNREKSFLHFRENHCCSMQWEQCPIARMLDAKYEPERWSK